MHDFIDCHNHLCAADFEQDLDDVIERAKKVGVAHALVVAENVDDFERIFHLAERYPNFCLPCLGVHPVQGDPTKERRSITQTDVDQALPWIDKYHDKIVAIGEVGLDFSPRICKTDEDKASQRLALCTWVEVGKKYNLPLSVHSRSAGRPTITLLKEAGARNALLHAFDGRPSVALEGVKEGYYFSIPPSIIRSDQSSYVPRCNFQSRLVAHSSWMTIWYHLSHVTVPTGRGNSKQKLVERLPLENILLETDCPALGPEKQVRNEPSNIRLSCEYIARIKKLDIETVAKVVWDNSLKLFPRIRQFVVK